MNVEPFRYLYLRRVVGTLFSVLGVDLADSLARRLARRVHDLNTPARRLAETRLALAASDPRSTIRNPQSTAASVYEHTARFWVEAIFVRRLLRDSSWRRFVTVEGEQGLQALARSPRGCLFATGCLGNPAVAALALARFFHPLHVVVDTFTQPQLRAWQTDLYADPRLRIVDRPDAARRVPDVLGHGGAVLMLADHERRLGRAVPVAFLGRTLNCYPTLGRLAKWFDVPIAVVSCLRSPRAFRFRLTLQSLIAPTAGTEPDALVRLAMTSFERAVLAHPEQYLWSVPGAVLGSHDVRAVHVPPVAEVA
jgi:lauroyl/myristoyl acyltransferase